jgi:hypothetical protein
MKKLLLVTMTVLCSMTAFSQTTATNFNVNDCSGVNHDLFAELDAGKIIVISWVMPCGSCVGPSVSALNEVQNYASTNPGRVVFYISDDYANTNCSSLMSWCNANGLSGANAYFSNSAVNMSNYGTAGMPKVVVLGGTSHTVLFNQNNGLNVTNFNNAINAGLATGVSENLSSDFKLSLFPNPSTTNKTTLQYTLSESSDVTLEIYNALGSKVKSINYEKQTTGKHESVLDFNTMDNGIYFAKLRTKSSSQVLKFTVSH